MRTTLLDDASRWPAISKLPDYMPEDTARLEDWVRYYWDCGLTVVPLKADRTPVARWAHYRDDSQAYDVDCTRWLKYRDFEKCNGIGVLTEFSRCVCTDVDLPFDEALEHLAWNFKIGLSATDMGGSVVKTRSGRLHAWFGVDDVSALRSLSLGDVSELGVEHVEFKAYGSCVPLPPSISAPGRYDWVVPPLPFAPATYNVFPSLPKWMSWAVEAASK
uniref:Putative bifunctional DNA primase/polymerase n=1 Tax=viral metagenome TaxID=1070528 RepID=A0A6M3IYL2_9ZZZZ